jgi:hypothetical protein
MRLRYLAILALFGLLVWFFYGAVVPVPKVEPMKPDPRIPTFKQSLADGAELERAQAQGRLIEAPRQHELRTALLRAAERTDDLPCDQAARETLRITATKFLAHQMKVQDSAPDEKLVVDGRTIDARGFLNKDAATALRAAIAAQIVPPNTPGANAIFRQPTQGGRFVCIEPPRAG